MSTSTRTAKSSKKSPTNATDDARAWVLERLEWLPTTYKRESPREIVESLRGLADALEQKLDDAAAAQREEFIEIVLELQDRAPEVLAKLVADMRKAAAS